MEGNTAPKLVPPKSSTIQAKEGFKWKTLFLVSFFAFVSGFIVYFSYDWFIYQNRHISTNNSYVEGDIWTVNSRIAGYIQDVKVHETQSVKKGETLLEMDDRDLQIELEYKQSRLKKAKDDLSRAKRMGPRIVPQTDLENIEALVAAAEAELKGVKLKLEFTKIRAPVDGVLSKLSLHPGQFIQPGQSLMAIVAAGPIWVQANFKETQVARIRSGMAAEVRVDAYPDQVWSGVIESIFPSSGSSLSLLPAENATGNFTKIVQRIPVRIKLIPKKDYPLRPGMSTTTSVVVD